jgi:hypothetical protein
MYLIITHIALLCFHCNTGHLNVLQCYIICTLSVLVVSCHSLAAEALGAIAHRFIWDVWFVKWHWDIFVQVPQFLPVVILIVCHAPVIHAFICPFSCIIVAVDVIK